MVELLLAHGADANAKFKNGETPLRDANERNLKEIADLLRRHGGRCNRIGLASADWGSSQLHRHDRRAGKPTGRSSRIARTRGGIGVRSPGCSSFRTFRTPFPQSLCELCVMPTLDSLVAEWIDIRIQTSSVKRPRVAMLCPGNRDHHHPQWPGGAPSDRCARRLRHWARRGGGFEDQRASGLTQTCQTDRWRQRTVGGGFGEFQRHVRRWTGRKGDSHESTASQSIQMGEAVIQVIPVSNGDPLRRLLPEETSHDRKYEIGDVVAKGRDGRNS